MNACLPLKSVSVKFAKAKEYLKKELQRWQVLIEATWGYKAWRKNITLKNAYETCDALDIEIQYLVRGSN